MTQQPQHINYKSDFVLRERFRDKAGNIVQLPDLDFELRYWVKPNRIFVASRIAGVYTNCIPAGDALMVLFKNHGLCEGLLKRELYLQLDNDLMPDGIQDVYSLEYLSVELWQFASDSDGTIESDLLAAFTRGPAFTFDDFTPQQLESLKKPAADAAERLHMFQHSAEVNESRRQQAEQERETAEAARAEEFAGWEAQIDTKADRSELSNVLAEEPLTPANFPDIDTYTREQLTRGLFRDLWLATLTMFPRMPTYGQDVAATLPDGSQYGLNGLVFGYEVAMKVMLWSKVPDANAGLFSYDYTVPADVPTLFPTFMSGTPNLNHAWRACEWVRVLTVYSSSGLTIRPVQAINLFAVCRRLEKIYGVVDFIYIHRSDLCGNAFGMCYKLVDIQLAGLHTDVSFRDSPLLSQESVEYMVEHATNTAAITITVHPQVYAKLTDETNTEWHAILARAAEKNINFATV